MEIIRDNWPLILKIYLVGYLIVFIAARLLIAAEASDMKWTVSERWKVALISLLSWLAVVAALVALVYSWLEEKVKINWKKRVWL
jgi:hypothetical protein